MNRRIDREKAWGIGLSLAVLLGLYGSYRFQYPHGARPCCLPCMMSALGSYANDHEGRFPDGAPTPLGSLDKLYPDYVDGPLLAGISGNRRAAAKRAAAGESLDEGISSWIYWPGFNTNDDWKLAIIWEREAGIGFNGHRRSGHAVGFVDGTHGQISPEEWQSFLADQERRRVAVRATHSAEASPKRESDRRRKSTNSPADPR